MNVNYINYSAATDKQTSWHPRKRYWSESREAKSIVVGFVEGRKITRIYVLPPNKNVYFIMNSLKYFNYSKWTILKNNVNVRRIFIRRMYCLGQEHLICPFYLTLKQLWFFLFFCFLFLVCDGIWSFNIIQHLYLHSKICTHLLSL